MSLLGINIAARSIETAQRELEITGQNISNANTPGYSRQIAITRPVSGAAAMGRDLSGSPLAPGGGVEISQVLRAHAYWLDGTADALSAQTGQTGIDQQYSTSVENLLQEPGSAGLQTTLDQFYAAFNNLATQPGQMPARDNVLRAGEALATKFRQLTDGLGDLSRTVVQSAKESIDNINHLAQQVANLNQAIGQAQAAGEAPNELIDQRDQILQNLTKIAGATVSGRDGGALVVSIGGMAVVQGEHASTLSLAPGNGINIVDGDTGTAIQLTGGELRAQQQWVQTTIPGYTQQISGLRDQLASTVNALHTSGKDLNGANGLPFYVQDPDGNLAVNPALEADASKVVAGDGTAGDGAIAQQIAGLRTAANSILPGYQGLVAQIGAASADSSQFAAQSQASLQQIQEMQGSESGVNLDEELAKMVTQQHAYAASARLLTVFDSVLSTLIQTGAN